MVCRPACIQGVLKVKVKVKGHVIRALLCSTYNRFFSQANGSIATKLAHDEAIFVPAEKCQYRGF